MASESAIAISGPWTHRTVSANGTRFHVASIGDGPLVLLLHGFPEFWWTWRTQLVSLAAAGYRAVAADLRGYGGSDKPPRGYDLITAAADAAGLIRALGEANAAVVGHDWGGLVAWTLASYFPKSARRLAVVSMAHPLQLRTALAGSPLRITRSLSGAPPSGAAKRGGYPLAFQLPLFPERQLVRDNAALVGARLAGRGNRSGLPAGHADPAGRAHLAGVPAVVRAQRVPARRPAVRPAHAVPDRRADPAPARHARPVRAAADRARRRPVRGGALPVEDHRRRGPLPARGAP